MWEIRALTSSWDESAIAVLLEPNSYIYAKGRRPLADLDHRKLLWSESGLVDAVVTLPTRRKKALPDVHYGRIHGWISPARWVSNPENPAALGIVRREGQGAFDLILLTKHKPRLHTSFLAGTQRMTVKETRKALFANVLSMVQQPDLYSIPPKGYGTPMEHAWILFREMSNGL